MDPATIVSIGSTLLGGLFGQKKEKYVVPDYAKIRKDAEAAGFNPLTALTMGPQGSVVSSGGTMGTAIADAGLMLADSLAKSKKSGILAKIQSQNAELQRKVQNLTLRPKVGGVYARQQTVPTVKQALGVKDGGGYASSDTGDWVPNVSADASVGTTQSQPSSSSDDASKVPTRPLSLLGYQIKPQSNSSDAEAFASRYGEDFMSPSWFAGWGAFAGDAAAGLRDEAVRRGKRLSKAASSDWARYKRHSGDMQAQLGFDWWKHQAPK